MIRIDKSIIKGEFVLHNWPVAIRFDSFKCGVGYISFYMGGVTSGSVMTGRSGGDNSQDVEKMLRESGVPEL